MRKTDYVFFSAALWSTLFSLLILGIIFVLSIHDPPSDERFVSSMVAWARTGYFSTHDLRTYIIGIFVFSSSPFLFLFLIGRMQTILALYDSHKILLRSAGCVFLLLAFSGIFFLFSRTVSPQWSTLVFRLFSHERGKQFLHDVRFLPLGALSYYLLFLSLKYRSAIRRTSHRIRFLGWVGKHRGVFFRSLLRVSGWMHVHRRMVDAGMILLIFFLIFNPRYPYSFSSLSQYGGEANHQFHHVISFIGPIHDVILGKSPLVDVFSQYGVLAVSIPAWIFSLFPLSFSHFILYVMLVAVVYTVLLYLFLRRFTGSTAWAVFGTVLYIKAAYFRWFFPHEVFVYPGSTPLRHFWDIVVLLSALSLFSAFSMKRAFLTAFFVSVGFFYNAEIGTCLLASYLATIGMDFFLLRREGKNRTRQTTTLLLTLLFSFFFFVAAISLLTIATQGTFPDWQKMFTALLFFRKGFFDIPMPVIGAYYIPLSIYSVSYFVLVFKLLRRDHTSVRILTFLLVYGLSSFVYYLGFNEPHHLVTVLHPSVILAVFLGSWVFPKRAAVGRLPLVFRSVTLWYILVLITFFFWKPIGFARDVVQRTLVRYGPAPKNYFHWTYPGTGFFLSDSDGADFSSAADAIRRYAGDTRYVLILSRYDTLLYLMSGKGSLSGYSWVEYGILYEDVLQQTIARIRSQRPRVVFLASDSYSLMKTDNIPRIFSDIQDMYQFVSHAGALDVYQIIK